VQIFHDETVARRLLLQLEVPSTILHLKKLYGLRRRNILVYSANLDVLTIEHGSGEKSTGAPMMLSYHDNDHYNSVRLTNGSKPPPPIKTFIPPQSNNDDLICDESLADVKMEDASATEATNSAESAPCTPLCDSDMPPKNKIEYSQKKRAPCPCGSGKIYRRCCLLTERKQPGKLVVNGNKSTNGGIQEQNMDGDFRVLRI
jgi:SEC-C motif